MNIEALLGVYDGRFFFQLTTMELMHPQVSIYPLSIVFHLCFLLLMFVSLFCLASSFRCMGLDVQR
jgi:hypothetical protein